MGCPSEVPCCAILIVVVKLLLCWFKRVVAGRKIALDEIKGTVREATLKTEVVR